MKVRVGAAVALVLLLAACASGGSGGTTSSSAAAGGDEASTACEVDKIAVEHAAGRYQTKNGSYPSLQDLIDAGSITADTASFGGKPVTYNSSTGTVTGSCN